MGEATIVLYPTPAIGHLVSMVELGKLILASQPSFSVNILITTPPYNAGDTSPYIASVSAAVPALAFHHLPPVTLPPDLQSSFANHEDLTFEVIHLNTPFVAHALAAFDPVAAFIIDFFCGPTLTVSAGLGIPSYFFYTSGVSTLASFLHFPTIHRATSESFRKLGAAPIHVPGLPPLQAIDMPTPLLERGKAYQNFLDCASLYLPRSTGIIVNSFDAFEPRAVKAISDGLCIPDGETPPIHCIGPLISSSKEGKDPNSELCLSWLDSQPSRSVVFLCFGSLGLFSMEQLKEIAIGLERSGQRFLWVVRNPPQEKNQKVAVSVSDSKKSDDPELEELLPKGFLERTREKGLVVKNWAPQVAVLGHGSVGGFVTHCGWNSVLESVVAGVPMVAWPLYAEQRINRVVLVGEIGIAIPMNESDSTGFVGANEVERRVSEVMESSHSVRACAMRMKSEAMAALSDGGSSRVALTELAESWKQSG